MLTVMSGAPAARTERQSPGSPPRWCQLLLVMNTCTPQCVQYQDTVQYSTDMLELGEGAVLVELAGHALGPLPAVEQIPAQVWLQNVDQREWRK